MKWFLHRFRFVRGLELDLSLARESLTKEKSLTESALRYIKTLETWRDYNMGRLKELEQANGSLKDEVQRLMGENASLKRHLSGGGQ